MASGVTSRNPRAGAYDGGQRKPDRSAARFPLGPAGAGGGRVLGPGLPVPQPEEAERCPGALRVRASLSPCATSELFPKCTWSKPWLEALGLPEPGLGKRSLQVRLQDRRAGFRSWPPERGVVTRSCERAWRGPSGVPSTGPGPGGTPSQVIVLSLRREFPFQHPQRRPPAFFFALVIMGRKLDPTKKEKRGPGRKARKQKGAETELVRFLPAGEGRSSLIPASLCSILGHNLSFACPPLHAA